MVGLAQLVRALVCGAGGRGFESRIPPHLYILKILKSTYLKTFQKLKFLDKSLFIRVIQ